MVTLVHEKEARAEQCARLEDQIQFLTDTRTEDIGSNDAERLQQLELIQQLRTREIELQALIEDQQKKWSVDRSAVNQQIRLLEKEKKLIEDEKAQLVNEIEAARKSYGEKTSNYQDLYLFCIDLTMQFAFPSKLQC